MDLREEKISEVMSLSKSIEFDLFSIENEVSK